MCIQLLTSVHLTIQPTRRRKHSVSVIQLQSIYHKLESVYTERQRHGRHVNSGILSD